MKSIQLALAVLVIILSLVTSQLRTPPRPTPTPPQPTAVPKSTPHATKLDTFFRPGNLHFVFAPRSETLKVFSHQGDLLYQCRAMNETFNVGCLHFGRCPKGTFRFGRTVIANLPAFGPYFTPLYDLSPDGPMHQFGRHGIGLHGGGSHLRNPFEEYQQLLKTHGCIRVSNHDLKMLVKLVHISRSEGRVSYITVQ
jgi:hypothetical protein